MKDIYLSKMIMIMKIKLKEIFKPEKEKVFAEGSIIMKKKE